MPHKCQHESDLAIIKDILPEIRKDIKSLMAFKWQVLGTVGALSAILLLLNIYSTAVRIVK